jgi:hypothetical protein
MNLEPWAKADVFFLEDALRRGMSAEEIAAFLRRTADEVRAKIRELDQSDARRPLVDRSGRPKR